ncbi:hypothetical protein ASF74_14920 [Arthrobacter sp. Leaf145]|nr:hypothetical protein ASF74_14920 [Arthrobacter sp. Leaf145]
MAEYLPVKNPGESLPLTASATITGGQLVAVSGVSTVAPAGANALGWVGVASYDAASGDLVTVVTGGVQELVTTGTVTAGDVVVAAASGTVSTLAAVTTPTAADVTNTRAVVGIALTTATTGLKVQVKLDR